MFSYPRQGTWHPKPDPTIDDDNSMMKKRVALARPRDSVDLPARNIIWLPLQHLSYFTNYTYYTTTTTMINVGTVLQEYFCHKNN